jgi:epoxide hydrolase 4
VSAPTSDDYAAAAGWRHIDVDTNGIRLHAVEAGAANAPLVLMMHGFPEFWFAWKEHIGPLVDAGFRVVALDQRGYNLSEHPRGVLSYTLPKLRADIVGALDALGAQQAFIVAHDWGAHVAWSVAQYHPDRIRKLAILNVGHPVVLLRNVLLNPRQTIKSWYGIAFQVPVIPEWLLSQDNFKRLRDAMTWNGDFGPISEQDTRRYIEAWSRDESLTTMISWYRAMLFSFPGWSLPRITVPTLMLWGENDQFLDRKIPEQSVALCDDGRLIYLDGTHWIHHEQVAAVRSHIKEFFTS